MTADTTAITPFNTTQFVLDEMARELAAAMLSKSMLNARVAELENFILANANALGLNTSTAGDAGSAGTAGRQPVRSEPVGLKNVSSSDVSSADGAWEDDDDRTAGAG